MIKRIYLEITNSCNLNCSFCEAIKSHDFMPLDKIKKNLDEIKTITDYVYLHILGEPLSHPFFDEVMNYCDLLSLKVQLVTNGTLLYKFPDILKHPSLRKLSVSIHSIDTLNIDDRYFDTINQLIKTSLDTAIELRFYDINNLKGKARHYYDELNTKYSVKLTTKKDSYYIKDNVYIYIQELFKWPDINDPYISSRGRCYGARNMLGIRCNGDVVLCCLDAAGHTTIGNINEKSLREIIDSDEYINIIDNMKRGVLISPLCQRCTYRLRFDSE